MKTWTQFNPATGEVIGWSSGQEECPGPDFVESLESGPGHPDTHFVKNGAVWLYSEAEVAEKRSMPAGWTWDVKLRKSKDMRSPKKRAADEAQAVSDARVKNYPPLADLADALYWQSQGDDSKMDAYLAAVKAVKDRFPKPAP